MRLSDFVARLALALREEKPAADQHYAAEHRREEREQTALDLLGTEIGERRTSRDEEKRYRKSMLGWTRWSFVVSFFTLLAVGYYAWVAQTQRDAYITAEKAQLGLEIEPFGTLESGGAVIKISNFGRVVSPRAIIWVHVSKIVVAAKRSHSTPTRYIVDIGPGLTRTVVTPFGLTADEVKDVTASRIILSLYATGQYSDGFGHDRNAFHCVRYVRIVVWQWSLCPDPIP